MPKQVRHDSWHRIGFTIHVLFDIIDLLWHHYQNENIQPRERAKELPVRQQDWQSSSNAAIVVKQNCLTYHANIVVNNKP